MKITSADSNKRHGAPQHIAQMLGDWWTRPDAERLALWISPDYREHVSFLWREIMGESPAESVEKLMSAAMLERGELMMEYERLFVGPATISCPPYEAVWRKDRPKHEQGTVMGQSTDEVKRIYRDLGLRLRPDQMELADHIAIELEALAYAWNSNVDARLTRSLLDRFQFWLAPFCASVVGNSRTEFYRVLAGITEQCFATGSPLLAVQADLERVSEGFKVNKPRKNKQPQIENTAAGQKRINQCLEK